MRLQLNPQDTLRQISDRFQEMFPNLKLEFASKAHGQGEGTPRRDILDRDLTWAKVSEIGYPVILVFSKGTLICDLESMFEEDLGVHLQVFRHQGGLWLETILHDQDTLEMANIDSLATTE